MELEQTVSEEKKEAETEEQIATRKGYLVGLSEIKLD